MSNEKRIWNPRAKKCSQCPDLKPIKDKLTKTVDPTKKECTRFGWLIPNELASKQAVCTIEKRRKRRRHTSKRGGGKK